VSILTHNVCVYSIYVDKEKQTLCLWRLPILNFSQNACELSRVSKCVSFAATQGGCDERSRSHELLYRILPEIFHLAPKIDHYKPC
jgi:L-rhamnose mutarotase